MIDELNCVMWVLFGLKEHKVVVWRRKGEGAREMEGKGRVLSVEAVTTEGTNERRPDKANYLTLPQCDGNTNTRPRADIRRISQAWCCLVLPQIRYSATLCGSKTRKVIPIGQCERSDCRLPLQNHSRAPRDLCLEPGMESIVGSYS
jgi:hypothetical protein